MLVDYTLARRQQEALRAAVSMAPAVLADPLGIGMAGVRRWSVWTQDRVRVAPMQEPADLLRGWKAGRPATAHVPALRALVRIDRVPQARVEIQDITGLGASKSDLAGFDTLDQMADLKCAALLAPQADPYGQLVKLMSHQESKIFHGSGDELVRYGWDRRILLDNDGGSHHFAAARRLAGQLGEMVWCDAPMRVESLDAASVAAIGAEFEVVAVERAHVGLVHDAASAVGATYFTLPMPSPDGALEAVFLPRASPPAMRLAALVRSAGAPDVVEVLERGAADSFRPESVASDALQKKPSPRP